MIAIKKTFIAALKNIGTAFYTIGMKLTLGLFREYNIAKANYFYGKAGEDIKEWLAKIDQMIEVNNMDAERRVVVAAAYLRNVAADWYETDKENIS